MTDSPYRVGFGLGNTAQMSTAPQPAEEFAELDKAKDKAFSLRPVFSGEQFKALVNYPVIVEMWQKGKSGAARRAYGAVFTEKERDVIAAYHARFYRWHVVTGTPHKVCCYLSTLRLLQRAVAFFGSL